MKNQLQQSAQGFGEHEYRRKGTLMFHYWEWEKQLQKGLLFSVRLVVGAKQAYDTMYAVVNTPRKMTEVPHHPPPSTKTTTKAAVRQNEH